MLGAAFALRTQYSPWPARKPRRSRWAVSLFTSPHIPSLSPLFSGECPTGAYAYVVHRRREQHVYRSLNAGSTPRLRRSVVGGQPWAEGVGPSPAPGGLLGFPWVWELLGAGAWLRRTSMAVARLCRSGGCFWWLLSGGLPSQHIASVQKCLYVPRTSSNIQCCIVCMYVCEGHSGGLKWVTSRWPRQRAWSVRRFVEAPFPSQAAQYVQYSMYSMCIWSLQASTVP